HEKVRTTRRQVGGRDRQIRAGYAGLASARRTFLNAEAGNYRASIRAQDSTHPAWTRGKPLKVRRICENRSGAYGLVRELPTAQVFRRHFKGSPRVVNRM